MKDLTIASVEALPWSVPLQRAVTQGLGSVTKRDTVVVKVTTTDGLVGYGESHNGRAPLAVAATVNSTLRALFTAVLTRPPPLPSGTFSSAGYSPTTAPAPPAWAR